MKVFNSLTSPSGGLSYHFAALRFRASLWQSFNADVERWLIQDWATPQKKLLIFGPSAGWTLPPSFFRKFNEVIAVEPDPLARILFRYRLQSTSPKNNATISTLDSGAVLPWFDETNQRFEKFLAQHLDAAILFSNLLGQVPLLVGNLTEQAEAKKREVFLGALSNRNWASYQDLLSARQDSPARPQPLPAQAVQDLDLESLGSQWFPEGKNHLDHGTSWLCEGRFCRFSSWEIRPGTHHLISFVHS